MALADDERRRTAFGTVVDADRYDDLRPGYPPEAVSWLVGSPDRPLRVLDLAAGTGKLTRVLRALGHEVVAVDPSEQMLDALRRSTGEDAGVTALVGTAEEVPLPDASVDAVTVGQAWHWLRPAAAVAELSRVLRPGGVLGLAWNARDLSVPWAHTFEELVEGTGFGERAAGEDEEGGHGPVDDGPADEGWWPRVPAPMTARERTGFPAAQRLPSPDAVAALASTYSGIAVREDADAVLDQVRALAAAAAEPDGSVLMPLVCYCYRYLRP
jgi:SAM-dependent methyltransferase